jgi:site-specific DNA-methyltransferase (adenine-specific)
MAKKKTQSITWTNERRKLADLIPWEHNPRTIKQKQAERLVDSVETFGQVETLAIGPGNALYNGHQRYSVLAGQYGMDYEVDVRVASRELTERERQQLTVYLHRGATGDWDMDLLANTFELDDLLVWGFDEGELLGFDFSEEKTAGSDTEPQVDKADELRQKWGVSLGQMWALGEHRIICGDCTDPATVARLMGGEKASIVFTDPPYGVSIGAKNRMLNSFQPSGRNLTDIEDDSATPEELKERLLPAFINIRKMVMADDCTVFLTAPQNGELGMMMMMMMKEAGLLIRHVLIWKKNAPTFSMGKLDYDYQHEPILLTWGKRHKRPMLGTHKTSVWEIDKPRASADHPTMKPVELYTNAYLNNSESGDVAYEPYSGSGTALIACQNLNRKCRAVEISPAYTSVAIERFFQHTGITPVLMD